MKSRALIKTIQAWLEGKTKDSVEDSTESLISIELLNADQMERHAAALALSHRLVQRPKKNILLSRLSASEATLVKSCAILCEKFPDGFSPAREWLLDNLYLIQEQVDTIRRNLPKQYGSILPQIEGRVPGCPRIYHIALEIIQHSDGRWDLESLHRFIMAYQGVSALTLGELWAIPLTLSVALIENLSSASKRIVNAKNDRKLAQCWANRMIEVAAAEPKKLVLMIAEMARSEPPMNSAFVAELVRCFQGASLALPISWIEQRLAEDGLSVAELVQEENRRQAADQISVSNSIDSLRRLSKVNWRHVVESMSVVHQKLQLDPMDTYEKMDFGTRDRYRHVVEGLARKSKRSELEVATCAIELAKAKMDSLALSDPAAPGNDRYCHVGFYLIGNGLPKLQKVLGIPPSLRRLVSRLISQHALFMYLGSIFLMTGGLIYGFLFQAYQNGLDDGWIWLAGIALALYGSQLAMGLVNLSATLLIKPQSLPRMDFAKGIPQQSRTLVVIPCMLGSVAGIKSLIEGLEMRFLGNRDPHLHFMLLTDFNDASTESMPDDQTLLALVVKEIRALNARYASVDGDIFFLCHRPRQWNPSEHTWMGRERKRGKLMDLNALLRGNDQTNFSVIIGRVDILNQIKYVMTLDTDTQLPRESVQQIVGTMVHPLNRPRLDEASLRVVEGYALLQPRIAEALTLNGQTRYVRLCGSEFGIDPYTRTVSNVYQDLFHEGSFIGKGIYDVDLFQEVLADRFPDNRILSHDLLEGCYLRSGFLSDVPLYEHSPSSYLVDVARRSRWIRGDWQLISWLFPRIPDGNGRSVANTLSSLSRFKLFDNLRRSLVATALWVLLGLCLIVAPETLSWFSIILLMLIFPSIINALLALIRKPRDMLFSQHVASIGGVLWQYTQQWIFYLTCLPHEVFYSLDAIARTCWRLRISKRHLLEWIPSDQTGKRFRDTNLQWFVAMWMGPATALVVLVALVIKARWSSLLFATPLLLLWLTSPWIARWVSRPFSPVKPKLDSVQIRFLHHMARKTWGFFERFVTAEDHWLPPDNYQETPAEVLARRTSPTNIGLSLLANLTAYDFGYISMEQFLTRTADALNTITSLERYRGHLYNWYSTETLAPLLPRYISTVDSGNLAGHLLTLRQGLLALTDTPLLNIRYLDGLKDTWDILVMEVLQSQPLAFTHFQSVLSDARASFKCWSEASLTCTKLCRAAEQIAEWIGQSHLELKDVSLWSNKLLAQCHALRDEIDLFAMVPGLAPHATLREIVTLELSQFTVQAQARLALIDTMVGQVFSLAQMDFSFLYDEDSYLFTIGFNVDAQHRDSGYYDMLSSEARLGDFVAIAQGQVLQESWFALGRLLVSNGGEPILISWSGSMFEYLMPLLVMPTYSGTLLDETYRAAVSIQIAYGKRHGVPWGVSESGYNAVDTQFNYLYRAFGVPGLGLKRGLEDDLVIAPYASVMALMVSPEEACLNLQRLAKENAVGKFGFYEAIDYTASRLPRDTQRVLVRSFMTHHQGMSFLSFSYLLHNKPMQKRFTSDPLLQAALLLLQERIPKSKSSYLNIPKSPDKNAALNLPEAAMRVFKKPNTRSPQIQILSNGRYHLVLTQSGGGYSRWKENAVTRWREDSTSDDWGFFSYVRDVDTGDFWSTTYHPVLGEVENFKAVFSEAQAEFFRSDKRLDLHTEVVVSPEDDIEVRRLRMHNRSKTRRVIEFTSYAEIVLAPQAGDLAQPTFSNLFVETEILKEHQAIMATRRSGDGQQKSPWMCHLLNVYSEQSFIVSYETDRARFVGRGRTLASPLAMQEPGNLSNTQGSVLDPIVAIRCQVILEPDALVIFDLFMGMTDTRAESIALVEKYQDRHLANRIFGLAWTYGQSLLHHLNISADNAQLFSRLASAIIYTTNARRADPEILASNRLGQSNLWGYSISGDLPIVLLHIEDVANIELVQQLIQAQNYWRNKGLLVDLVILNEEQISYRQLLQDQITSLIAGSATSDHTGNIVLRHIQEVSSDDLILLQSVARVVLSDKRGTLKEQLRHRRIAPPVMPLLNPAKAAHNFTADTSPSFPPDLAFFNGLGGFNVAGDEYLIRLIEGAPTPAPWINVLANPAFGTLVSESGQGYTWIENSHEFRLTPWDNDPLKDSSGEAFYLRDEETGHVWSPTALPCRGRGDYQTRHGFGYSVFEHVEDGIHSELWMYVASDAAVKFALLKIRNDCKRVRQLSATGYVAWVLGDLRNKNAMFVVTDLSESGALLAQNHYNTDFGDRTAFFDAATSHIELLSRSVTGDRAEFIGRNGTYHQPEALKRKRLSGRVGAGLDPCGVIQLTFNLAEGQSREIVFTLGAAQDRPSAEALIQQYHGKSAAELALMTTQQYWQRTLGKMRVTTPDPSVNFLANGWLLYQVLSSRLWGRTGYYQCSGAFGFRDQLQDVMSLTHAAPELFRAQLLLCAAHQFEEGDVQHWWHPPKNRGVRTHCSDDYLWLPFALCRYVETTGDMAILDEVIPFLQGHPLKPQEDSYYELSKVGSQSASLYQHAVRSILHGLRFGIHGLPLMGSCDWNDGMNRVGNQGKGESVWLGFFLYKTLKNFSLLANRYGDHAFATHCDEESNILQKQIEAHGWDGEWYRRAYFDDGTPLGSASNSECQIDSIAQSWSVLSGAADPIRAKKAMQAVYDHLVSEADGVVKLLTPPFNKFKPNPGYIEGYVPGIRENGGQYTHGALWAAIAFAQLGEKERAWQLLQIINPINHGLSDEKIQRYKIEPYVVAGDVYSVAPHIGRGGWSWYTGSASWLYRLITETLLGVKIEEGCRLRIDPLLPDDWKGFSLDYNYGSATYKITINRVEGKGGILLDEVALDSDVILLSDDAKVHHVMINIPQ